jgi:nucleoside-diphosphate-sugar epimerase
MKDRILVIGASGQIGTVLTEALRDHFGNDNVLATDIKKPEVPHEPFKMLDILNAQRLNEIVEDFEITQIYHLAAILSANGEWNPMKTWNVNLNGLLTVLDLAKNKGLDKVFFPSSIAIYGKSTPRKNTPQDSPLLPETVYGISKVTGELWCNYFHMRYGLDVRSIRYPGIISYEHLPGGGTTDYAVEIFHEAVKHQSYTCFLSEHTRLPMLYMPDAIRATLELMEAPSDKIRERSSYNIAGMSFTPGELATEIKKTIPEFTIDYKPDFRQQIAESWTESIDDSVAQQDWGWKPAYNISSMARDMITHLKEKYAFEQQDEAREVK